MSTPTLNPTKGKRIRTWSPEQILKRQFKELPMHPEFKKLIGNPEPNFASIIGGPGKQGKSVFALMFAKQLVRYGKVLYVSSEELINLPLQMRIAVARAYNPRIRFAPVRDVEDIETLIHRIKPKFIIIDSIQICGMKLRDFNRLKHKVFKNRKSFHLISQTTNKGKIILSQGWIHAVDVVMKVMNKEVTADSRFNFDGAGTMNTITALKQMLAEEDQLLAEALKQTGTDAIIIPPDTAMKIYHADAPIQPSTNS